MGGVGRVWLHLSVQPLPNSLIQICITRSSSIQLDARSDAMPERALSGQWLTAVPKRGLSISDVWMRGVCGGLPLIFDDLHRERIRLPGHLL